ncbi:DUF503 domain-containing protein [Sporohalobacter salinus]|uniref:DUF503 domain-containing protein n=1 Tax=Sporohalobacter salinus TaxID=1494606 RepID=UPI0019604982|nr:DUF503 domain-containing protein [Sporohalobacter salinus]MBM7622621.1 uncharacterized protein YlxP (DUF503 family) [Sporohalobacter salinus]
MIGCCTVEIRIPMSNTLKYKRGIIKSMSERLKNQFNIAVAEVDKNDNLKLATIGIVTISNDNKYIDQLLSKVVKFIEKEREIQLVDYSIEFI